jgi:hypothetical protein
VKVGNHSGGIVAQLPPRNPCHPPPLDEQQPVALSILLKGKVRAMRFPPIELNDQPLLGPEAIDLEESTLNREVRIASRLR